MLVMTQDCEIPADEVMHALGRCAAVRVIFAFLSRTILPLSHACSKHPHSSVPSAQARRLGLWCEVTHERFVKNDMIFSKVYA